MRNIDMYANTLCSRLSGQTHTHTLLAPSAPVTGCEQTGTVGHTPDRFFLPFPLVIDSVTQATSALQMDEFEMDVFYLHNLIWMTLEVYHKQMAISGFFGFQREQNHALIDFTFHKN